MDGNHASGAPLISLLRDHILDTIPIATGQRLFGVPVKRRRLHDVRSLAAQSGLSQKRIRHALGQCRLMSSTPAVPETRQRVFDAEAAEAFAERVWQALPIPKICVKQKTMVALVSDRPGGPALSTTRVTVRGSRSLRAIAAEELAAFDRRFVTPCKLAHELGLPSQSLTQRVAALGLPFALDPAVFKARFYRRDQLEAAVAALAIRHRSTAASRRALVEC